MSRRDICWQTFIPYDEFPIDEIKDLTSHSKRSGISGIIYYIYCIFIFCIFIIFFFIIFCLLYYINFFFICFGKVELFIFSPSEYFGPLSTNRVNVIGQTYPVVLDIPNHIFYVNVAPYLYDKLEILIFFQL